MPKEGSILSEMAKRCVHRRYTINIIMIDKDSDAGRCSFKVASCVAFPSLKIVTSQVAPINEILNILLLIEGLVCPRMSDSFQKKSNGYV